MRLSNPKILDIRSFSRYSSGHIKGAKWVSVSDLIHQPDSILNRLDTYYIYCEFGNQSRRVVEALNQRGYSTVNVLGGYHNYLSRP